MPEDNKTDEFLQKLAPCIERGELEKCVEEAARVAGEMGIGAKKMLCLSSQMETNKKHDFAYVFALSAAEIETEISESQIKIGILLFSGFMEGKSQPSFET